LYKPLEFCGILRTGADGFDPDTIENVYLSAAKLADDWAIPKSKLDEWKAQARGRKWNGDAVEVMNNHNEPGVNIKIMDSYDDTGKTARIVLGLGWMP